MAMTKKEQAEYEAMRDERDTARALRWPEYDRPATIVPPSGGYVSGWLCNEHSDRIGDAVSLAWSSSTSFGYGASPESGGARVQGGRPLFQTQADALRALRLATTERYARQLLAIDMAIAAAERD